MAWQVAWQVAWQDTAAMARSIAKWQNTWRHGKMAWQEPRQEAWQDRADMARSMATQRKAGMEITILGSMARPGHGKDHGKMHGKTLLPW